MLSVPVLNLEGSKCGRNGQDGNYKGKALRDGSKELTSLIVTNEFERIVILIENYGPAM